jgi:hypothetical protein
VVVGEADCLDLPLGAFICESIVVAKGRKGEGRTTPQEFDHYYILTKILTILIYKAKVIRISILR